MVEFQIYLLNLPLNARRNVLRTMEYGEFIGISLCSKSTRQLASSLKYTASRMTLKCAVKYLIGISFQNAPFNTVIVFSASPSKVAVTGWAGSPVQIEMRIGNYQKTNFKVNNWVLHFKSIFNGNIFAKVEVPNGFTPLEDVQAAARSIKFNTLEIANSHEWYMEQLIKTLVPREEIRNYDSFHRFSKVLPQNLKVFTVYEGAAWKLDDLLMMNARYAYLQAVTLTSTDLNRFIKLWFRGSNPKLIFLQCIIADRNLNENEVKRGIDGIDFPQDTSRTFDKWIDAERLESTRFRGGFDIVKEDGTIATIRSDRLFSFMVWQ